ncbi:MAG TPA: DUF998 domain-containing protein [Thermoanaerobaculia bacterium]|nr:DUF998 domain-containing protein [Thermoanaerobaculia bacterium]
MNAVIGDPRRATRLLLSCGIAAGPLFFSVAIIQALTRPGYNIRQNAISQLSLGDLGWIQISSFILTGLLAVACALGIRRVLSGQRGGTWGALLVLTFGLGLIVAGVFPPDPAFGFPPGAPAGPAMPMSSHALLHALGFFISMLSAIIDTFVFARRFWSIGNRRWAAYCAASGVAAPILIALSIVFMSWSGAIVALAGAVVFGWAAAIAARLRYEVSTTP